MTIKEEAQNFVKADDQGYFPTRKDCYEACAHGPSVQALVDALIEIHTYTDPPASAGAGGHGITGEKLWSEEAQIARDALEAWEKAIK